MPHAPTFAADAFDCPHCRTYAHQHWFALFPYKPPVAIEVFRAAAPKVESSGGVGIASVIKGAVTSQCAHCGVLSFWVDDQLCWPAANLAPAPHVEMPPSVRSDYEEAASILSLSPRGSAALLRLSIQRLFKELGAKGDLNAAIAEFAAKGLNRQLVDAMDILRVVGNNAVHPGEMDLKDDQEIALHLFDLVNEIVDELISRPARTARLYAKLPEGARSAIEKRDAPKT